MNRRLFLSTLALAPSVAAAGGSFFIRNAKILTVTKGRVDGALLIRDGRIAAIGANLAAPADAVTLDAEGGYLMPGIVDCHAHVGADAINEGTISVSSMVRIEDVLAPDDVQIYRGLAAGVTTSNVLHGSANTIGGQCSVVKMRWGKSATRMVFAGAKPGIKFALGENVKRSGGGNNLSGTLRYPATRMGVEDVVREAFNDARAYQRQRDEYQTRLAQGERVLPPRRDFKLEPLVEVLEGKRLVHVHCYRSDEILMLLRAAEEFGFRIRTLQHGLEAYKVAKEIARHGAGVSTFADSWSYKIEAYDAIPYNAALCMKAGVLTSLNTDAPVTQQRHLLQDAAKTLRYGQLTDDEALSLITINPARQLMIEDRVGSLEVGKDADIVLTDKHPLSLYAKVRKVFIDGEVYFDREQDIRQRAERAERRKALIEKLKPAARPAQKKGAR
jgi:imidazolonepropionase-like amidohydrolase